MAHHGREDASGLYDLGDGMKVDINLIEGMGIDDPPLFEILVFTDEEDGEHETHSVALTYTDSLSLAEGFMEAVTDEQFSKSVESIRDARAQRYMEPFPGMG